jgi:hypothetical protein
MLKVSSFLQASPPTFYIHLSSSPLVPYAPPISCYLFNNPDTTWQGEKLMRSFLQSHTTSSLSDHPILENPQPTFFPQCEEPSYTHARTYKTTDKIRVIYILNFMLWITKAKQNIMGRMVAGIPYSSNYSNFFMKSILIHYSYRLYTCRNTDYRMNQ